MTLASCIERLSAAGLLVSSTGDPETTFDRLTADSREVGPTDGFVAICGSSLDGHLFIDKAVSNGATAIVCEAGRVDDVASITRPAPAREPALLEVTDSRRAWLEISSLLHADPGQALTMTAVTGTNGKTTVATLVKRVLTGSDRICGFIGTTEVYDGARITLLPTRRPPRIDSTRIWLPCAATTVLTSASKRPPMPWINTVFASPT